MRVSPDLYSQLSTSMQQSEAALQTSVTQLSSGKRVTNPSDDPGAFGGNLRSLAAAALVDRYSQNADDVTAVAQTADTALSSVVTSLTQAITLGTEGANATLSSTQRDNIVTQLKAIQQQVLSAANTTSNGRAVFAGTADVPTAFTQDLSSASGVAYLGDTGTNQVSVGDSVSVSSGVPGSQIFSSTSGNVFASLANLATAVTAGDTDATSQALSAVSAAIAHVGQVRAVYGGVVSQLSSSDTFLSQEKVTLSSQQSSFTSADLASAATQLTEAQTEHSAVLAMAAKLLPESLLNYLH